MPTGHPVHRLSDIDPENRTATCANCGPVKIRKRGKRENDWRCNRSDVDRSKKRRRRLRGDRCQRCGFVPEHDCQLDLDHIDGNHHNNASSNLQTLCANCHRLKTYLNKDWE